jgi:hypothetical protein
MSPTLAGSFTGISQESIFPPPGSFAPARSPPLDPGIIALALVSAIVLAATIVLIATTALHIAWSDSCFQWLAATMAAACVSAHARNFSPARIAFASGVMCGALPSLWSAAWHATDHWDDFMTWLPNALYLWKYGAFPTAAALPVASGLPGYPPASSIVLAAVWNAAGEVVEAAGAVINVISLMILPGFVLRTLRVARPDGVLVEFALGVALAILTTVLNFGLDWHWVLSSLPDTVTLVAFVVAFRLAAELVILGYDVSRSHFAALAAVLGLITNLKQTGVVLVVLLVLGLEVVAISWMGPGWRQLRPRLLKLLLVCVPSLAIWWCWHIYLTDFFPAYTPSLRPIDDWYFALLPNLLMSIGRNMIDHWLFFAPILVVVARGLYVLGRRWLARNRAPVSPADQFAAGFALIHIGYSGFLIICYLAVFDEQEIRAAAEWFRYQAHTGGAGLLVALMLAMERWSVVFSPAVWRRLPEPLSVHRKSMMAFLEHAPARLFGTAVAAIALPLAASVAIVWGPGIFHSNPQIDLVEIQQLRRIGQSIGRSIARAGRDAAVELITYDQLLPVIIVRYDVWANAGKLIRSFIITPAYDAGPDMALRYVDAERNGAFVVALKHDGRAHCAVWVNADEDLLFSETDTAPCRHSLSVVPHDLTFSR